MKQQLFSVLKDFVLALDCKSDGAISVVDLCLALLDKFKNWGQEI